MLLNCIRQLGEKLSGWSCKQPNRYYIEEHILHDYIPFRIIDRVTGKVVDHSSYYKTAFETCRRLNKYGKVRIIET